MRLRNLFGTDVAALLAIAGSVLIVAAVAQSLHTCSITPEFGSMAMWSAIQGMLPIPGGASHPAPEIDPKSAGSAIALVVGGAMLILGLRRARRSESVEA